MTGEICSFFSYFFDVVANLLFDTFGLLLQIARKFNSVTNECQRRDPTNIVSRFFLAIYMTDRYV